MLFKYLAHKMAMEKRAAGPEDLSHLPDWVPDPVPDQYGFVPSPKHIPRQAFPSRFRLLPRRTGTDGRLLPRELTNLPDWVPDATPGVGEQFGTPPTRDVSSRLSFRGPNSKMPIGSSRRAYPVEAFKDSRLRSVTNSPRTPRLSDAFRPKRGQFRRRGYKPPESSLGARSRGTDLWNRTSPSNPRQDSFSTWPTRNRLVDHDDALGWENSPRALRKYRARRDRFRGGMGPNESGARDAIGERWNPYHRSGSSGLDPSYGSAKQPNKIWQALNKDIGGPKTLAAGGLAAAVLPALAGYLSGKHEIFPNSGINEWQSGLNLPGRLAMGSVGMPAAYYGLAEDAGEVDRIYNELNDTPEDPQLAYIRNSLNPALQASLPEGESTASMTGLMDMLTILDKLDNSPEKIQQRQAKADRADAVSDQQRRAAVMKRIEDRYNYLNESGAQNIIPESGLQDILSNIDMTRDSVGSEELFNKYWGEPGDENMFSGLDNIIVDQALNEQ